LQERSLSKTGPTIAAGFVRGLLALAVQKGASEAHLLARAGIDPESLDDQDNRLPFAQYLALLRAGKDLCADPALALHFGEAFGCDELSIVGLIARASPTVADGFAQVNRYGRLVAEIQSKGSQERFTLVRASDGLWLVDNREDPSASLEITESTFARMVSGARRMSDAPFVKAVRVTHAAPEYRDEYARIFGVPVHFSSSQNALLIEESFFAIRLPNPSAYAFGVLCGRADELLANLEGAKTIRGHVEKVLLSMLHTGEANVERVSESMGMSRQTLFRKLKHEGLTFEKVHDALRHQMAMHYLRGKKVSVNETAYLVGFSDPAAFSRAFKRWTGTNPRAARSG
jgi:AraC-like DNA-binding protein